MSASTPAKGSSDLSAKLPKRIREQLELIFLRHVLNMEAASEEQEPFDLSMLSDPNFQLTTRPEDRLKVSMTGITISLGGCNSVSYLTKGPRSVVPFMFERLALITLPGQHLTVSLAKFRFEFPSVNGGRPKSLTFEIGAPLTSPPTEAIPSRVWSFGRKVRREFYLVTCLTHQDRNALQGLFAPQSTAVLLATAAAVQMVLAEWLPGHLIFNLETITTLDGFCRLSVDMGPILAEVQPPAESKKKSNTRRARASGTRSNTGCSTTFR